ncbi:MAG: hypothetical protein JWO37_6 [Acidimicrobiales bacterium]|nr:hypothetical protein [Acidimicrobiales bacterium]
MKGRLIRLGGIVIALFLVPAIALAAFSWSTANGGVAAGKATAMSGGNLPTVTPSGRDVTVAWTQSTLPSGPGATAYTVTRNGTTTVCTTSTLSCTDVDLAAASSPSYTVTPKYQNWVGATSTGASASIGSPTLTLSPTSATAGQTVTATVTNFLDNSTVTFVEDGTRALGTATVPASGGSAFVQFSAATGSGNHTVVATGSRGEAPSSKSYSVSSLSFGVSLQSAGNKTAGTAFNVVVQAMNGASTDATYAGAHALSISGTAAVSAPGGQAGTLNTANPVTFDATGKATISVSLYKALASGTLTVSDGGTHSGSVTTTVDAAAVALTFTSSNPSCSTGTASVGNGTHSFTSKVSRAATVDGYGNAKSASVDVTVTNGTPVTINTNATESATASSTSLASQTTSVVVTASASGYTSVSCTVVH